MIRVPAALLGMLLLTAGVHAADHCVVLQYHHVSEETPGITSVTPEQFQQHLDYLADHDYTVMAIEDVVDALEAGTDLPERCVSLTIDDAYVSTYSEAYPRAERYGFPLTVFVSTRAIDSRLRGYLDWEQIRELAAHGVRFQNHSHNHDHLVRRQAGESDEDWEQRIAADIQSAQNRIETETGIRPTLFAYPYGEYNLALKRIVGSMGLVAFGQQSGPVWRAADLGALPRFPMASLYARMRTFPTRLESLPLPITGAFPEDPVVALDEWQPSLTLVFRPDVGNLRELTCYLNGSPEVSYDWLDQPPNAVVVTPKGRLNVGRNRVNCTLPIQGTGRFGWYSHNWIRREADGSWYREPG